MAAVVYAFGTREKSPRPWQNHELSELYRVVDLLAKAGLPVETDMGISDEGDPWFVFCRTDNGDVVVHFARIDGHYVAASAVVDQSYRGGNFREIIDQLVSHQPLVMPKASGGTSLFLHPAVVLTAFVATALFYSHRAEAADGSSEPVHVSLNKGDHYHTDLLLRLLAANVAQHSEKTGVRTQTTSESGTQLASLMAIAIAAIVPLVDQSLNLSLLSTETQPIAHPAVTPALHDLDARNSGDGSAIGIQHAITTSINLVTTDPVSFADFSTIRGHGTASVGITASLPVLAADTAGTAATTTRTVIATDSADHALVHNAPHQALIAVLENTGTTAATGSSQPVTDTSHHFTLSDIDPFALQVFSLVRTASGQSGNGSHPATATGVPGTDSPQINIPSTGSTDNPISAATQADLFGILNDFSYSGTHPLKGDLHPTDSLRAFLSSYEKINSGPIQVVIYDDPNIVKSIFPFTKDILFVSDAELGGTLQTLHGANAVTLTLFNGDVMKLIGVITVDASHPLAG